MNETPALSGSGARRGKRSSVYDIPEEDSPTHEMSDLVDRSALPEGVSELQDSVVLNGATEESFVAQIGDDTMSGSVLEESTHVEETEPAPASVKGPAVKGRKRKSHVLEPAEEDDTSVASRKKGPAASQTSQTKKSGKKNVSRQDPKSRRSRRVSDVTDMDVSVEDASADTSMQASELQEAPVASKRRGRPPRVQPDSGKENSVPLRPSKPALTKEKSAPEFKKPSRPVGRPKSGTEPKNKVESKKTKKASQLIGDDSGKLVDVHGNPLSKKDIEQMSTTSVGSRYGRGRHLSVFREMDPEAVARVGRTGRHRVAPIDFWKNDRIAYDTDGSMTSIVKNQAQEPERKSYKGTGARGRKKMSSITEEEEDVDLDPWEEDEGMLIGNYRDFDPVMDVTSTTIIEDSKSPHPIKVTGLSLANSYTAIAWADKGIVPSDVPDGSFKYTKLASVGSFFNWGLIELRADQMKRTKNSRKMHMVFNVQSGTVEVKVHENEFTVHRRGIWQVPRGESNLFNCSRSPSFPRFDVIRSKKRSRTFAAYDIQRSNAPAPVLTAAQIDTHPSWRLPTARVDGYVTVACAGKHSQQWDT